MGTSLTRNRIPIGPYRRLLCPGSWGGAKPRVPWSTGLAFGTAARARVISAATRAKEKERRKRGRESERERQREREREGGRERHREREREGERGDDKEKERAGHFFVYHQHGRHVCTRTEAAGIEGTQIWHWLGNGRSTSRFPSPC